MNTRQELLFIIEQLSDERLPSLLEIARSLKESSSSVDRRAFLKLPEDDRDRILAEQSALVADDFQPGSEAMEWVEHYIEDENWDDQE
ncbi:MAG: hypothetical protein LH702_33090 [Phormidesmis sp. CAN_BIN44]|nr:hypothetical protein [Phormidesmis sp. CAN_BIN44]